MRDRITGAKALMRALQAEGVKTIFGYPGGSIMPTYDALFDYTRGEKKCFDHILVRHEQGAVHAAEGYARVSGEVGVALVTSGPGATNTLTGVADAMLDSTPIVVIAGQVAIGALGTDAFQEVDLVGLAQPISKWSYQIRHAEDVAWAVSRAFYIARMDVLALWFSTSPAMHRSRRLIGNPRRWTSSVHTSLIPNSANRLSARLPNSSTVPSAPWRW